MTLTARDRKIALIVVPFVLVVAFWFLVFSPKRAESAALEGTLVTEQQKRDEAVSQADVLENARESYAKDYATVVRLGKAVPSSVDMPSLLVQLEQAAKGTSIRFSKVLSGTRAAASPLPAAAPVDGAAPAPADGSAPAAPAGDAAAAGAPASTAPGTAAETAGEGVQDANATSAAEGAPAAAAGAIPTSGAAGLDSLPLEFSFRGRFFDLADFFHEMKRFVYLSNNRVRVEGRLMSIDGFSIDSSTFPTIKAEVKATVYLAPKSQGTTAGATPTAPAPVPGAPLPAPGTAAPAGEAAAQTAPPTTPAAPPSTDGVQ